MLADRVRMGSGGDKVLNIETVMDNFVNMNSSYAQDSMWEGKPAIYMTRGDRIIINPNPKALKYNMARVTIYHITSRITTPSFFSFYPSSGYNPIPHTQSLDDGAEEKERYMFPSEVSGVEVFYFSLIDQPDRTFSMRKEGSGSVQTNLYVTDVEYFNI